MTVHNSILKINFGCYHSVNYGHIVGMDTNNMPSDWDQRSKSEQATSFLVTALKHLDAEQKLLLINGLIDRLDKPSLQILVVGRVINRWAVFAPDNAQIELQAQQEMSELTKAAFIKGALWLRAEIYGQIKA